MPETNGKSSRLLDVRGLTVNYGPITAVRNVSLHVGEGEIVALLGPNGAGKTSVLRAIAGLLRVDGTIRLGKHTWLDTSRKVDLPAERRPAGYVFQEYALFPHLTVRANVAYAGRARVDELLELVGLRDRASEPVSRFSLGMKQRLGIAGALLSDPKLLLLDEPANGLDPAGIVAMRETLRHLATTGKTVFVSSHLLAEVQVLADVVGIIAAGKLVREGTLDSMLASEAVVRARVPRAQAEAAVAALAAVGPSSQVTTSGGEDATDVWLRVDVAPDRAADVNRALAAAGIEPSGLESGSDLEDRFLELTGGHEASAEGTFQGIRT